MIQIVLGIEKNFNIIFLFQNCWKARRIESSRLKMFYIINLFKFVSITIEYRSDTIANLNKL